MWPLNSLLHSWQQKSYSSGGLVILTVGQALYKYMRIYLWSALGIKNLQKIESLWLALNSTNNFIGQPPREGITESIFFAISFDYCDFARRQTVELINHLVGCLFGLRPCWILYLFWLIGRLSRFLSVDAVWQFQLIWPRIMHQPWLESYPRSLSCNPAGGA